MFRTLYDWVRRTIAYFFGQRWVRFGIVGVAATLTYFVLALLFEHWDVPVFVGNTLSYVFGFGVSYTGHRSWTFQSTASHGSALPKFLATQTFGLGLNTAIIWVLMRSGLPYILSMPVAIVTVPVAVYLISKFWVFRDPAAYVPKAPRAPEAAPSPSASSDTAAEATPNDTSGSPDTAATPQPREVK